MPSARASWATPAGADAPRPRAARESAWAMSYNALMPSRAEISKARRLVQDIILAQSNSYIKKLLHDHDVASGATKEQFEERLDRAITGGVITLDHLQAWIDETEGWGDEHAYLYRVPNGICHEISTGAQAAVAHARLGDLWNAAPSLVFPKKRKLTGIYGANDELTFVWHQGVPFEERAPKKDKPPLAEDDGGIYSYIPIRRIVTSIGAPLRAWWYGRRADWRRCSSRVPRSPHSTVPSERRLLPRSPESFVWTSALCARSRRPFRASRRR